MRDVAKYKIITGKSKSCGCIRRTNLTGLRFGKLTAEFPVYINRKSGHRTLFWECVCDCGKHTRVASSNLLSGGTISCGCYQKESASEKHRTHGYGRTNFYKSFKAMHQRCYNSNAINYPDYGGRGIKVCDEWEEFESFLEWSKRSGYKKGLTLDRIDNDGPYAPWNCRWADKVTQQNNKRNNRIAIIDGEQYTFAELSRKYNLDYSTIWKRANRGLSGNMLVVTSKRASKEVDI